MTAPFEVGRSVRPYDEVEPYSATAAVGISIYPLSTAQHRDARKAAQRAFTWGTPVDLLITEIANP
jgi:hypothetical protein